MSFVSRAQDLTFFDVQKVLEECLWENPPNASFLEQQMSNFDVKQWQGVSNYYFAQKREKHYVDICYHLLECVRKSDYHISEIDSVLFSLFECRIIPSDYRLKHDDPELFKDIIALRAYDILKRLPSCPLNLINLSSNLDAQYFFIQNPHPDVAGWSWETLKASNYLSHIIIQMILSRVAIISTYNDACPNELAQILETASRLAAETTSEFAKSEWFIVRAVLWTSWQRAVMLCFYFDLSEQLNKGFDGIEDFQSHLLEITPILNLFVRKMSKLYAAKAKADSMCSWAFNHLRSDPVCIGMDFRTFHNSYRLLWGTSVPRCRPESGTSCLGKDPGACRRFEGLIVCDQSLHDFSCSPISCTKLVWDEASYRAEEGARAVCLNEGLGKTDFLLRYCKTSQKTLAICRFLMIFPTDVTS